VGFFVVVVVLRTRWILGQDFWWIKREAMPQESLCSCVPKILDIIVCSSRKPSSHPSPFVAKLGMQLNNDPLLFSREVPFLKIRSEMVSPS
jgi:hypothetical protein